MNKPGRNEPCHCGSGKKYKKCCIEKETIAEKAVFSINEERHKEDDEVFNESNDTNWYYDETDDPETEEDENENIFNLEGAETEIDPDSISVTQKAYPVISAHDEKLVEEWWAALEYEKKPHEIKRHIEQFMNAHPQLVENLGLENEVLFELGANYKREGQIDEFIHFLLYIRKEFASTYVRSAGFYDLDIIAWLITQGRQNEIENFLDYLKAYPEDFVDQLFDVVALLQATDNIEPLLSLASATYSRLTSSTRVFGGTSIAIPLVSQILSRYLQEGFPDNQVVDFVNELIETLPPIGFKLDDNTINYWKTTSNNILRPFTSWPADIPKNKSLMEDRYEEVSLNFRRYINERAGISWTSAWYYSALISDYFTEYLDLRKGKVKTQFDFSENTIDRIIVALCKNLLWIDCTKSISLLEAIYHFAAYLQECGNIDEEKKLFIQKDCAKLYNSLYANFKTEYVVADCFKKFPYLG